MQLTKSILFLTARGVQLDNGVTPPPGVQTRYRLVIEPAVKSQMNRLSLRKNRLKKFKIAGKLPIILEEFLEYTRQF